MSNWSKPDLSSTEVDAISEYKGRDIDNAVMFDAGVISNIPENAIRFNIGSRVFQRREAGTWVDKPIAVSGGGTGANNASGARSNLGLGAVAVESVLPIAKGGTGQTTALAGLNALGGRNASNLNTGTVAVSRLPNATTSVAGISQLSNSTTSDSQTLSATARAVKNVQDDVNLKLTASSNLSDVGSALTARQNIGAHNAANLTTGTVSNDRINAATTSMAGIAQLINSTTNSSQTGAATANSVRLVAERSVSAGNGLTGGGSLQASRTITMGTPSTLSGGSANSVSGSTHTHAISSTAVRDDPSTSTLLEAKGMDDHRTSGDHDSRYARDINNVSGGTYYDYIITEKPTFFYHSTGGTPSDSPTGSQSSVLTMPNPWGDPMMAIPNSGEGLYWRNGNSTAWRQAATKSSVDAITFPSGTRMLFQQTSAPTGWTKDTSINNRALRVVSGTAGSGGANAFTTAFNSARSTTTAGSHGHTASSGNAGGHSHSITVNNHTLNTTRMPSHAHSITQVFSSLGSGATGPVGASNNSVVQTTNTNNTGGGGAHNHGASASTQAAHSHSVSVNSNGNHSHTTNLNVQYTDVIVAVKD